MANNEVPEIGKLYRHFKGGTYKVLDVVTNANDIAGGLLVIYQDVTGGHWARKLDDWNSELMMDYFDRTQVSHVCGEGCCSDRSGTVRRFTLLDGG